ncbi:secretion protein HlyD family protein [Caldicellulosiruptor hydrothermalis 108]|uniref:Secretion protein HlyD family protein n=1 Tax=Caldicellulosiruptor hydrothermalis (strain DSM 18901 / VKM B-2411 / 108) TaxID=632292 RepID=E4Q9H1_CALH1|nr:HlyD family efflux transporter periplasmic adaptor subunit [Caldicellulosiruptor hydrothermalis]ADQ06942.1 secretion protein HlyD family protein [Caldicellulosiruptor hydrothermalis 108]
MPSIKIKTKLVLLLSFCIIFLFFLTGCKAKNGEDIYSSTVEVKSIDINSEIAGRVEKVYVEEGSKVKKGDVIVKLDSGILEIQKNLSLYNLEIAKISSKIAKENLEIAKLKYALMNKKPSKYQLEQLKESIFQLQTLKEGNAKNISLLRQAIEDLKAVRVSNTEMLKTLTELKIQLNSLEAQNESVAHQINSLEVQLQMVKNETVMPEDKSIYAISVEIAQKNYSQALEYVKIAEGNLKLCEENLKKASIISPADGIISIKGVEEGQFIGPGSFVAQISLDYYYLKIYVPSTELGKVKIGKEVSIVSEDGQKAYGKIVYISDKAEFTPRNVETKEEKQKMVFMVKIDVTKNKEILKPGMIVNVIL